MYRGLVSESEAKQWHRSENVKLKKLLETLNDFLVNGGLYEVSDVSSGRKPRLINVIPTGRVEIYEVHDILIPAIPKEPEPATTVASRPSLTRSSSFEILNGDPNSLLRNSIAVSLDPTPLSSSNNNNADSSSSLSVLGKSISRSLEKLGLAAPKEKLQIENEPFSDKKQSLLTTSEPQRIITVSMDIKKVSILSAKHYQKFGSIFSSNLRFSDFKSNNLVQIELQDGSVLLYYVKRNSEQFANCLSGIKKRIEARKSELVRISIIIHV